MTTSPDELAARFVHARETHESIDPPRCEESYDVEGAYLVQRRFAEQYCTGGRARAGYKLSATNNHVQALLGITEPIVGVLFDDDVLPSPAILRRVNFHSPVVEAEIAFIIMEDLPEICSRELIVERTSVAPAIEFADSRLRGWPTAMASYSAQDVIADNALSGRVILGEPTPTLAVDFRRIQAQIRSGGEVLSSGRPAMTRTDPLSLVGWLARTLHRLGGNMSAGTVIATGAVAGPVPFDDGTVTADLGILGSVTATILPRA